MRFEDFLSQEIGTPKENTVGELRYCCPFCGEQKYKFYVKQSLDSTNGMYHCKKCGEHGNPITFMKSYYSITGRQAFELLETKNIDIQFPPTLEIYNTDLTESEKLLLRLNGYTKDNSSIKSKAPELPIGFKLIKDNLNNKEVVPYLRYLKNRGITLQQILDYSIGYIINGYCYSYGINNEKKKIVLRNSVIFFTYDNEGKYIYWNTRSIETNPYIKSINAPSKPNEYGKSDVIFNLNIASKQKFVVITEGVFDALTFDKYGIATFGKQVSKIQVNNLISSIPKETPIYIMLDTDATDFSINLANKLISHFNVVYLVPHGNEDANDMGMEKAFSTLKHNRFLVTPESIQSYKLQQKLKL
ncbi:DNA primase / DNA helicase [Staphylococcus phage vB_SauH_SPJ2]|nr:DNA primase / DNA helicase [Staphylococcus phage LSA2308]USZ62935.1 DNA primase [Staphylococcus phage LSA2311]WEW53679.1 DNA primase / DNA helicase [Staphylococcus phage vB_SauH_SPJ2]